MKKAREIRQCYEDAVARVSDDAMRGDIRVLLEYIERLQETLARQASRNAVRMAKIDRERGGRPLLH